MRIEENERILFQGDSVTDVGRIRNEEDNLGSGYPMMVASWFAAKYPEMNVHFLNRGNSGESIKHLEIRWKEDCLDLKPTMVSILIGINDCWRKFDRNEPTTPAQFECSYRNLLDKIKKQGIKKIIMLEPFVLPITQDRKAWREDLDPKIHVIRELARESSLAAMKFMFGIEVPVRQLIKAQVKANKYTKNHREQSDEHRISSKNATDFLVKQELLPVTNYFPDVEIIKKNKVRVFIAVGTWSLNKKTWLAETSQILADKLGCELVTFPGHHGSYMDMPDEWATTLRSVLHKVEGVN